MSTTRKPRAVAWGITLLTVHLVLLFAMLTHRLDFLFNDSSHRAMEGDFLCYYRAAWAWLHGRSVFGAGPGWGYRYHPLFAITVGALLTHLHARTAFHLWITLDETALAALLWFAYRRLDRRTFFAAATLMVLFSPYYLEVFMGQTTFIAAVVAMFGFQRYERGERSMAALLILASALIKPLALLFIPLLALRRDHKMAVFIGGSFVALAVPYFLIDPRGWRIFVRLNVLSAPQRGFLVHAGNQGLHNLIADVGARLMGLAPLWLSSYRQLPPGTQLLLHALPVAAGLVAALVTWKRRDDLGLGLLVWAAVYFLAYKDVWEHCYTFLLPLFVFLLTSSNIDRRYVLGCMLGLALPTAFALYDVHHPIGHDPEHVWKLGVSVLHHATKVAFMLALEVGCVRAAFAGQAIEARHLEPRRRSSIWGRPCSAKACGQVGMAGRRQLRGPDAC